MPERTDRRIQSDRRLLLGVVILLLAVVAGAGGYLWLRATSPQASQKPDSQDPQPVAPEAFRNEPLTVTLYIPLDGRLATQTATIRRQPDTQLQAREAVLALLADKRAALVPVLRDIKLSALYCDVSGTAYLDLSPVLQKDIRASAEDEFLALYALVNSVLQNFDELKQVRVLLDGKEAQTLAGHMDLSRTFTKRMDLVKQ